MSATIHHLYRQPTVERSRLIDALDRIKVNQDKPNLRIVGSEPRPRDYWRRRHNAFLRQQLAAQRQAHCQKCKGTGEVGQMGTFGEYEGTEPCWVCQRITFDQRVPLDLVPF